MKKINVEKILSYSAIFAAVAAVLVAVYEARINREFQELSVQPFAALSSSVGFSEDSASLKFFLNNNGLGPARLMELEIYLDDQLLKDWRQVVATITNNERDLDAMIRAGLVSISVFQKGEILSAGDSITLFGVSGTENTTLFFDQRIIGRIKIKQRYCSLFGKCWVTHYPSGETTHVEDLDTLD